MQYRKLIIELIARDARERSALLQSEKVSLEAAIALVYGTQKVSK